MGEIKKAANPSRRFFSWLRHSFSWLCCLLAHTLPNKNDSNAGLIIRRTNISLKVFYNNDDDDDDDDDDDGEDKEALC